MISVTNSTSACSARISLSRTHVHYYSHCSVQLQQILVIKSKQSWHLQSWNASSEIANQENFKMRSISKFVPFNSSIWKFLTFNTGLPLFDMGTDFRTFFFYLSVASFHPNWAMLTLGWILVSPEIPKPRYIPNRRHHMFFQDTEKYRNRTFWRSILRYCFYTFFYIFLPFFSRNIAIVTRNTKK